MIKNMYSGYILTDKILTYVTYDAKLSYDIMAYTTIYLCIIILLINLFEHLILNLLH